DSVKELHLDSNQHIVEGSIPSNLEMLVITSAFKREIPINSLPNSIKKIFFCGQYNENIRKGSFPNGLKSLSLMTNRNTPFKLEIGSLPDSLESIEFSYGFSQSLIVGVLPLNSLTYLDFGNDFNTPIDIAGVLPSSLKVLKLGQSFNQPILPNIIPFGVERIEMAFFFVETLIEGSIPKSVKYLCFENGFNDFPNHFIPSTIQYLDLGFKFNKILKREHFSRDLSSISGNPNLKVLIFGDSFNIKINRDFYLPPSIISIKFGSSYNQLFDESIEQFPSSLLKIELGVGFNQPLNHLS
ncbi:hypothetical protein DICPUDRAFT_19420, partial [Dictyostelium purpureum]